MTSPPAGGSRSASTLLDAVSALGRIRFRDTALVDVLGAVVGLCVEVVPGAAGATLTVCSDPSNAKRAASVVASRDDLLRLESAHGPAADVIRTGDQVHARGDLRPWPTFALAAAELGVSDVVAIPLPLGEDQPGCLSVYSQRARFSPQVVTAAEVLARHAAATVANGLAFDARAQVNEQLTEALRSRETIGLAKGILMRQERCSEADAFRILVGTSQRLDQKVRDVARNVVALTECQSRLPPGAPG
jgi:hypothetical protein